MSDKGILGNRVTRREFLEGTGKVALGVGLGVLAADAMAAESRPERRKISANDKIKVGFIGLGGMGMANLGSFMNQPDVEVVAVCDVDAKHLAQAEKIVTDKYERKPVAVKDFRQVLDMKDVDAVAISTPDHWHALPFIMACEAGKDIFCEKPISHDITEAKCMLGAARQYKTVVQIDTWQRSVGHFQDAVDFVRSGKMGKIGVCRAWIMGGTCVGHDVPATPPAELDWEFWQGPADRAPYQKNRCHFVWRYWLNYGGGLTTDWGVHMIDIVLLAMNAWHPLEVSSNGRRTTCAPNDDSTVPDTQLALLEFPDFLLSWEVRGYGEAPDGGRGHGSEFLGENGKLIVDREGIIWKPNGDHPGPEKKNPGGDHVRDFLDNMRSRGKCRSDIETMYCTTVACHLANLSYLRGASIKWDGAKGEVVGDRKAMELSSFRRDYHKPWKLPKYSI